MYVRSAERLLENLQTGKTGTETYEVASDEDLSVMRIAEAVRDIVAAERDLEIDIELVENPRAGETLVEEFRVDTSKVQEQLGWEVRVTVADSIQELLR